LRIGNKILLNVHGEAAEIVVDNEDEMKAIIRCPNCGNLTEYGKTRMISGYTGCDACYFTDLQPRVLKAKQAPEGSLERQAYIDGKLYRGE